MQFCFAIKTPYGLTERNGAKNVVLQGTCWSGLCCTATMNKLGQQIYNDPNLIYKYKGKEPISSLQMVDDVLTIQKCTNSAIHQNVAVNSFMDLNKQSLSKKKCAQMYVGSNSLVNCPNLKVHDEEMKRSRKEKYLGDYITPENNNLATILDRKGKGFGIISDIMALIKTVPNGKKEQK